MRIPDDGKCEWCGGTGLVTAYHREYRGGMTVVSERADRSGEVHARRMPGTVAAHCSCGLGAWMRERIEPETRRRVPTLSDVINGRVPYQLERSDADDEGGLTDAARAFLRRWKGGFGGRLYPVPAGGGAA